MLAGLPFYWYWSRQRAVASPQPPL